MNRFHALLLVCLAFPLSLFSDSGLSEKSPFLPPGHGKEETKPVEPVVQPQGPISREIEFRGIVEMNGEYQFSVYNKNKQKGYWLKENARQDGISVNSFDEDASSIVVLMNGRSERLTLMTATENPLPVAKAGPSAPNNERRIVPNIQNNSSSDSKTRRVPRRRVILPKKSN